MLETPFVLFTTLNFIGKAVSFFLGGVFLGGGLGLAPWEMREMRDVNQNCALFFTSPELNPKSSRLAVLNYFILFYGGGGGGFVFLVRPLSAEHAIDPGAVLPVVLPLPQGYLRREGAECEGEQEPHQPRSP